MGATGLPGGVLILANEQTNGMGRLNRTWVSPKSVNLYLSLLLRPHQPMRDFPLFSLATALGVVQALRVVTQLEVTAKWPNDIMIGDKKIAGILLETGKKAGEEPYLVIGIGVNVNYEATDMPEEIAQLASSLKIATGHFIDRTHLVNEMLIALVAQYALLDKGESDLMISNLSQVCSTLGKQVRVTMPDKIHEGLAESISKEGALVLRLADGSLRTLFAGDVTKLAPAPPPLPRRHWSS